MVDSDSKDFLCPSEVEMLCVFVYDMSNTARLMDWRENNTEFYANVLVTVTALV